MNALPLTTPPRSLRDLPHEVWAEVSAVDLPEEEARWLAALGVHPGARVVVLRRAILGGPLHLRTGNGGSFALGQALAAQIRVTPAKGQE